MPKTPQPPPTGQAAHEEASFGRLHIGFVLPSLRGGGAERIALALANALMARGHRIDLLMARFILDYPTEVPKGMRLYRPRLPNASRAAARRCRAQGIRVSALAVAPTAAWDWFALGRRRLGVRVQFKRALYAHAIARYVRVERPQLLLSLLPPANAAAIYAAQLLRRAIPVVACMHNIERAASAWLPVARALYPQADALVACSRGVRLKMEEMLGLAPGRIRAIGNPVPVRHCWRLAQEEVAHPWFAAGEPPVVLTVGREAPQKDYGTLVEAFALLRRAMPARLVIMGDLSAHLKAALTARAQGRGVAEDLAFLDFDQNPFRYMRRAGLFALSSLREGLPTVLIEALACGTPVVSTDTPCGPEEILEGGKLGKLTPMKAPAALAQAMAATLRGDRPSAAALKRRAADFSCERAADEYQKLFAQVLGMEMGRASGLASRPGSGGRSFEG